MAPAEAPHALCSPHRSVGRRRLFVTRQEAIATSHASFRITYGGSALDAGTMDVRDLAPSLLALADLIDATSHLFYGDLLKPSVRVQASFPTASFSVDLSVASSVVQWFLDTVSGKAIVGSAALLTIIDVIQRTIQKRRELRGRNIIRIKGSGNTVEIILDDGDRLSVDVGLARCLSDKRVAAATRKVLDPLSREGIDRVSFYSDPDTAVTVQKNELHYFEVGQSPPDILVNELRRMVFSLVAVTFRDENKWRLSDGNTTFFVTMEDEAFLQRVDDGESFAKGDQLVCEVRVTQQDIEGVLKTDYTVVRVLEHRRRPTQLQLLLDPPTPPSES